jgi:hypothetical protein
MLVFKIQGRQTCYDRICEYPQIVNSRFGIWIRGYHRGTVSTPAPRDILGPIFDYFADLYTGMGPYMSLKVCVNGIWTEIHEQVSSLVRSCIDSISLHYLYWGCPIALGQRTKAMVSKASIIADRFKQKSKFLADHSNSVANESDMATEKSEKYEQMYKQYLLLLYNTTSESGLMTRPRGR